MDMAVKPAEWSNANAVVRPRFLSHGTLEVYDLVTSRRFYEEFLGLQTARHSHGAIVLRCNSSSHVVCIQSRDKLKPASVMNHWGLDVNSRQEVDAAHEAALANKERYGIRTVWPVQFQHGAYSFYMEDQDHNWWEIQYYEGDETQDMFDFGDRFGPDGSPL